MKRTYEAPSGVPYAEQERLRAARVAEMDRIADDYYRRHDVPGTVAQMRARGYGWLRIVLRVAADLAVMRRMRRPR
jgi:hypothetical protein